METTRTEPAPAKLPQELTEFLLEFALALQRHGMYPGGHPSVDAAVEAVARRLTALLRDRAVLSLGIARRQIVVEGVATDSRQAVLRVLAERLHRHRLGAVALRRGVDAAELHGFLHAIATDPDRETPIGQASGEALSRWPNVGLYPITYEQLQLAASEADDEEDGEGSATAAAQLWIGLAQAALARAEHGREAAAATDTSGEHLDENPDPVEVARAINEHHGVTAYDQMIVGYMLQLAGELRREGGASAGVKRRVSLLIRELEPRTLQHLLQMGGDAGQRDRFLRDAADGFGASAMLDLVRAAAATQQQDISTSMLRMLSKMSTLAEHGPGDAALHADAELRAQVRQLIDGWSLEDPNPENYTEALQRMASSRGDTGVHMDAVARLGSVIRDAAPAADAGERSGHGAEPLRIIQMALEVGETGPACARAIDDLLRDGRHAELFELLDLAGQEGSAADLVWAHVGTPEHVRGVLAAAHVDFDALDQMLVRMPAAAVLDLLLDCIAESESRTTRMGLFVRIAAFGSKAVPHIMKRMGDERWYVVRNMLALLNEIGSWPDDFSPLDHSRHEQPMVRREALELAARIPASREAAISQALADPDERTIRAGINAARNGGLPAAALRSVLRRLDDFTLPPDVRAALVRLLDGHDSPVVLNRLADMTLRERRFRRPRLASKTPEMLAALWVLAGLRAPQGRAARVLALAREEPDPAIMQALHRP